MTLLQTPCSRNLNFQLVILVQILTRTFRIRAHITCGKTLADTLPVTPLNMDEGNKNQKVIPEEIALTSQTVKRTLPEK
jgi:hypothetical protein